MKAQCKVVMLIRRKVSVFALTLLLVGMLPIALNIPLVQADVGGTGKFLTIEIIGEGYVTATKVESGETWNFPPSAMEKVGAGTVLLEAFASEDWIFSHWGGDLDGISETPTEYRTEKYGVVAAVFEELTYTITASAGPEGWIDPVGAVSVTHGADITFTFGPWDPDNYHISAIVVDGNGSQSFYAESYTFTAVIEDHTIHVIFSEEGTVSVPEGPGGNYFVDQYLFIEIGEIYTAGVILGDSLLELVQEGTAIGLYAIDWETTGAPTFEGGVVLALLIPAEYDPWTVRVIHSHDWQAIWSDVNNDLQVDGKDISIVANAIKFKIYYPFLDANSDGELNELDILVINENRGATLEDVTGPVVPGPDGLYFVTTIPLGENAHFRWK